MHMVRCDAVLVCVDSDYKRMRMVPCDAALVCGAHVVRCDAVPVHIANSLTKFDEVISRKFCFPRGKCKR